MKMRHLFLSLFMAMTFVVPAFVFAQNPTAVEVKSADGSFAISIPPSSANTSSETNEFFELLQKELKGQNQNPQQGHQPITLKRFSAESASFFVAIAAVQMESLLMNFSDNPRALQDHIESIKDPIGHLSFYMFMVANGYATNYLSKSVMAKADMDPMARAQAMRSISYMGMAAGSIASSLTAEVSGTLKECAKIIFSKEQEAKEEQLKVCDGALEQWTRSTKVQQYTAQIISLVISTEAAKIIEMRGRQAVTMTTEALIKAAPLAAKKAFMVASVQVAMSAVPGRLVFKGLGVVGKIAQFAGFTFIDHLIAAPIQKATANVWQPAKFAFRATELNDGIFDAKTKLWGNDRANLALADQLEELKKTMSEWRQAQLTKFHTSHSIWTDSLKKIIDQTNGTYGFYQSYLENLFSTKNTQMEIEAGRLPPAAMNNENGYPYRLLPLFGVKLSVALPPGYEAESDLYLSKPSDLESLQIQTVRATNEKLKAYVAKAQLQENDQSLTSEITQDLDAKDLNIVGRGISKINDVVVYNRRFVVDTDLKVFLMALRAEMGNPYPILTPGMAFTYAYETHSFHNAAMKNFPKESGTGKWVPRTSDYLLIQMLCGGEGEAYKYPWGFAPSFISPKIVNPNVKPKVICSSLDLRNIHGMKIETTDGKSYVGLNEIISQNLRPEIFGNPANKNDKRTFAKWWNDTINTQLLNLYQRFDKEYIGVLAELTQNWNGYDLQDICLNNAKNPSGLIKCNSKAVDATLDRINMSEYLDKNALLNLRFEADIYLSILNEIVSDVAYEQWIADAEMKSVFKTSGSKVNSVIKIQNLNEKRLQDAKKNRTAISGAQKDFGGFLRRIKAGPAEIIPGTKSFEIEPIAKLRQGIQTRLAILARTKVKDGVVQNFPDKEETKKALTEIEEALKSVSGLGEGLSKSQKAIYEKAASGIQSVVMEISTLNMAFYASKYKLGDNAMDIVNDLKASQNGTKPAGKAGFNPFGGPSR